MHKCKPVGQVDESTKSVGQVDESTGWGVWTTASCRTNEVAYVLKNKCCMKGDWPTPNLRREGWYLFIYLPSEAVAVGAACWCRLDRPAHTLPVVKKCPNLTEIKKTHLQTDNIQII